MRNEMRSERIERLLTELRSNFSVSSNSQVMKLLAKKIRIDLGHSDRAIPLRKVIDVLGLDYRWSKYDSVDIKGSACLRVKNGKFQILVNNNSKSNWKRTRFSIAHEIGHYMFLCYANPQLTYDMQHFEHYNMQLEEMCNEFAKELLVPHDHIKEDLKNLQVIGFDALCSLYAVSQQLIMRSITDCNEHTSWIVMQRDTSVNNDNAPLRVAHCYPSYKKKNHSQIWLPRGMSHNRFVKKTEEVRRADYEHMVMRIDSGRGIREAYYTRLLTSRRLDFGLPYQENVLLASSQPEWINE